MTKKGVEEQSREFSDFAKTSFWSRKVMKSVEQRLGGTFERIVAIRNFFYNETQYVKGSELNRHFARYFGLKRTEREFCRALNAEIISRLIEYNSLSKFHRIRDPKLSTRDVKLTGKILKSRGTIEAPQCTLSFMKCFGISTIPCDLLAHCNSREIRTASSFFTNGSLNQSTLSVTMDEPAIDTSHTQTVIKSSTRTNITTIDSGSDQELSTIAKPISQKRKPVIKETPVGRKAEKGDESGRTRVLARYEVERGDVNENETESESENGNESIIVVEYKRVFKTNDGSGDEDENESAIKVENEMVIKIEDDSEREKEIYYQIEEYDDLNSSVDEDLYKAKLELLSQVSNELSLLNSKKRKKQRKKEDKDKSGSKRAKIE